MEKYASTALRTLPPPPVLLQENPGPDRFSNLGEIGYTEADIADKDEADCFLEDFDDWGPSAPSDRSESQVKENRCLDPADPPKKPSPLRPSEEIAGWFLLRQEATKSPGPAAIDSASL